MGRGKGKVKEKTGFRARLMTSRGGEGEGGGGGKGKRRERGGGGVGEKKWRGGKRVSDFFFWGPGGAGRRPFFFLQRHCRARAVHPRAELMGKWGAKERLGPAKKSFFREPFCRPSFYVPQTFCFARRKSRPARSQGRGGPVFPDRGGNAPKSSSKHRYKII